MSHEFKTANGTVRPAVPWMRVLDTPERGPLTRADIETLRADGLHDLANIAEKYVARRERKGRLRRRVRRLLASVPPDRKGSR